MLHAIGDRGIDMALTAFERAAAKNGTRGRRHRVEHIEVPRLADLARFKAAGVVASTQAIFPYPDRNHLDVYVPTLGPERAHRALAYKAIDDAGAVQAFGSDWPVFSADVVRGIATAVTRTTVEGTPAGGWEPQQRHLASRRRSATSPRDAAFAERAEQERGTLANGQARRLRRAVAGPAHGRPERIKDIEGAADRARRPGHLPRRRDSDGHLRRQGRDRDRRVAGDRQGALRWRSRRSGRGWCSPRATREALAAVASDCEARGAEALVVPTRRERGGRRAARSSKPRSSASPASTCSSTTPAWACWRASRT